MTKPPAESLRIRPAAAIARSVLAILALALVVGLVFAYPLGELQALAKTNGAAVYVLALAALPGWALVLIYNYRRQLSAAGPAFVWLAFVAGVAAAEVLRTGVAGDPYRTGFWAWVSLYTWAGVALVAADRRLEHSRAR